MTFPTTNTKLFSKVLRLFCFCLLACQLVQSAPSKNEWLKLCLREKFTEGANPRSRMEACLQVSEDERQVWFDLYNEEDDGYVKSVKKTFTNTATAFKEACQTVKEIFVEPEKVQDTKDFTPEDYHLTFTGVRKPADCKDGQTCLVRNEAKDKEAEGVVYHFNGSETTFNSIINKPSMTMSNAKNLNTQSGSNYTVGEYRVVPFDLLMTMTAQWSANNTHYTFVVGGKRVSDFLLTSHYMQTTRIPPTGFQIAYFREYITLYYGNVYNVIVGSKRWLCTSRHVKPELVYFPPEVGSGYMPMHFVEFGKDLTCAVTYPREGDNAAPVCKHDHNTCVMRFAYHSDNVWEHGEVPITILKQTKTVGTTPLMTGITSMSIKTGYSGSPCYATESQSTCIYAHLYGNNPVMNTAHLYRVRSTDFEE